MKRQMKFRGKVMHYNRMTNPDDGWVTGFCYKDLCGSNIKSFIKRGEMVWEVKPETISSFTGLFDANEKEIYEGDVVRFLYDGKMAVVAWHKQLGMWCLLFDDDLHSLLSKKPLGKWLYGEGGLKVVGNVFDNPIE